MYAPHGRELEGESPLRKNHTCMLQYLTGETVSQRQLRRREAGWEGSRMTKIRGYEQKGHRRPAGVDELAQHNEVHDSQTQRVNDRLAY